MDLIGIIKVVELLSPPLLAMLYLLLSIIIISLFKLIFKKESAYRTIFLSIILIGSIFSKDLFTNLPFDILDNMRILAKLSGIVCGIIVMSRWYNQSEKSKRLS